MRNLDLRNSIGSAIFGTLVLVGAALVVNAQNPVEEQREWARAQVRAQREQQDCLLTRSVRECRQAARAARRAEQERMEYQQTLRSSYYDRNDTSYYNRSDRRFGRNAGQFRIGNYTVDQRGAELLRTAVQNGYSQGYRQGQIDRQYRRAFNYGDDSLYRSGTYGYQSYVARNQYQQYFQQGYQRGYEDGYHSSSRYGTRSGNGFNILGNVLNTILNIRDY